MNKAKYLFMQIAASKCPDYRIDDENIDVINAVIAWYCNDDSFLQMKCVVGADLNKGIALIGNVGSGKTLLMEIIRELDAGDKRFTIVNTRHVARQYAQNGHDVTDQYGRNAVHYRHGKKVVRHACFDEVGAERSQKHFGNEENVMAEIIMDRYEHFVHHGLITSFTSNHGRKELEVIYGDRVVSRLNHMCNFIGLGSEEDSYTDRRKS